MGLLKFFTSNTIVWWPPKVLRVPHRFEIISYLIDKNSSGFGGTLTKKFFKCAIGDFSIDVNPPDYEGYTNDLTEEEANLLDNLTHFQKLILVKCFKEEKVTFAISDFVCEVQGKTQFISVSVLSHSYWT